ncbi:hypothetical protein OIHEL45_02840 [Sulfitobacter indolifex HEL-45]|uniref:Uncharacterized protein n=1 Tax=Sulfitobacter indolifex HEL-45 TaxID=391624 RepID=A0ABP2DDV5_9RHOB|nr:hypothetical protein OIHEL45_02840 [Sulfitobacter indolifex HEL-45]
MDVVMNRLAAKLQLIFFMIFLLQGAGLPII